MNSYSIYVLFVYEEDGKIDYRERGQRLPGGAIPVAIYDCNCVPGKERSVLFYFSNFADRRVVETFCERVLGMGVYISIDTYSDKYSTEREIEE